MSATVPSPALTDVSARYADLKPQARVWRTPDGYVLKVYTWLEPQGAEALCVRASASLVDGETGKALTDPTTGVLLVGEEDADRIGTDSEASVEERVEALRDRVITRAVRAELNRAEARALAAAGGAVLRPPLLAPPSPPRAGVVDAADLPDGLPRPTPSPADDASGARMAEGAADA